MPKIGEHNYSFYEQQYYNGNRGIKVVIEKVGRINNVAVYAFDKNSNPHKNGVNKYLNNPKKFYENFGTAIAEKLESTQRIWEHHINWPKSVTYKDYTAVLEEI